MGPDQRVADGLFVRRLDPGLIDLAADTELASPGTYWNSVAAGPAGCLSALGPRSLRGYRRSVRIDPELRVTFPGVESVFVVSVMSAAGSVSRCNVPPHPGQRWSGATISPHGGFLRVGGSG